MVPLRSSNNFWESGTPWSGLFRREFGRMFFFSLSVNLFFFFFFSLSCRASSALFVDWGEGEWTFDRYGIFGAQGRNISADIMW